MACRRCELHNKRRAIERVELMNAGDRSQTDSCSLSETTARPELTLRESVVCLNKPHSLSFLQNAKNPINLVSLVNKEILIGLRDRKIKS